MESISSVCAEQGKFFAKRVEIFAMGVSKRKFVYKIVNHSQENARGNVHTQGIENFWSLLKRTLRGTYVAVEPFHLHQYLAEQCFRYNNRATKDNKLTDSDRFARVMA